MSRDEKLQLMHLTLRIYEIDPRNSNFKDIYTCLKKEMLDEPKEDNRPTASEYFNKKKD